MSKVLIFDAGHTKGIDPGACGNGLQEVDLTLEFRERVAAKLSAYDATILMVPQTDSLAERAAWANSRGGDAFISFHINAGGGAGFESYIWSFDHLDGTLADEIQAAIHYSVMAHLAPLGVADRGMKARNFDVLRLTDMPAVLLEGLFIDNPQDAARLKDEAYKNIYSNAVAWGLVQAFNLKLKVTDPCVNCARVNELIIERGTLFAENTKLRQIIAQANGILSSL